MAVSTVSATSVHPTASAVPATKHRSVVSTPVVTMTGKHLEPVPTVVPTACVTLVHRAPASVPEQAHKCVPKTPVGTTPGRLHLVAMAVATATVTNVLPTPFVVAAPTDSLAWSTPAVTTPGRLSKAVPVVASTASVTTVLRTHSDVRTDMPKFVSLMERNPSTFGPESTPVVQVVTHLVLQPTVTVRTTPLTSPTTHADRKSVTSTAVSLT